MKCENILKSATLFNDTFPKVNHGQSSQEEQDYIFYFNFELAKAIIKDLGESWSLEVARHILAYYDSIITKD